MFPAPRFSAEHNARLKLPNPKDEALNKSEPDDLELLAKFHGCQKVCLENTWSRLWPATVQRRRIELWEESARKPVPTIRLGTTSAAQQTVEFYSTGIMIIADPTDATLECDPKSGCCEDHFYPAYRIVSFSHMASLRQPIPARPPIPEQRNQNRARSIAPFNSSTHFTSKIYVQTRVLGIKATTGSTALTQERGEPPSLISNSWLP
jgi:hypothetical protein